MEKTLVSVIAGFASRSCCSEESRRQANAPLREALDHVIDEKIEHPEKDLPKKAAPKRSPKVIVLAAVLQNAGGRRAAAKPARRKKAA